ncbi:MAG: GNAT family N-acetyltransferase [Gaiellaceae bacterium]
MARPPLRPAAFFWAVVPPCRELLREDEEEPDFLPPRLEEPGEFEILAARSFDIPFSFSFSYCFSFLTLGRLPGMRSSLPVDEGPDSTTAVPGIPIRLLAPGDEGVVRELATYDGPGDPEALLADPRTLLLVAFDGERPVGLVLAHELPRRHGDRAKLFVYEVDVAESHRRRGIASALLARLAELARERGIRTGFVLAEPDNGPANALYRAAGGATETVNVLWQFGYGDD